MTQQDKPLTQPRSVEETLALGLANEAFREGYEQRESMIRLGGMLRQMRESTGYTQEALAARTGLTQPAISRLESGFSRHVPTIDTVMRYMHGCQYQLVIGAEQLKAGQFAPAVTTAATQVQEPHLDFQAVF